MTISVTLNFRTISAAVAALRNIPEADVVGEPNLVIEESTVVGKPPAAPAAPSAPDPAPSPRTAKAGKETAAPAASTAKPSAPQSTPSTAAPAAAPSASAEEPPLDYGELRAAVLKLAALSTDKAVEVNTAFGVKTMKELEPARWREALVAVEAAIAELS